MSSPVDAAQAWAHEYQARFGAAPGTAEMKAELERCVQMCQELLAERDRMRLDLARLAAEHDQYLKSLYHYIAKEEEAVDFDEEKLLAEARSQPPLRQLIAELEQGGSK
jgi:hypothetical protein